MNLKEAYSYSVDFLNLYNIAESEFKALCIVCHLCGINNNEYLFHLNDNVSETKLKELLLDLKSGEPLQYVLGVWDFYGNEFYVGNGVLIPRPETEELVSKAVNLLKDVKNPVVIDLCSGSGCIGISIAKEFSNAVVYCIEKSNDAFKYLVKNSRETPNIIALNEDINNLIDIPPADMIISNPPYIRTNEISRLQNEVLREPVMALDGGCDGLDFYRIINEKWFNKLKPCGYLMLEIGNEQGLDVKHILNKFKNVNVYKDIYGNDRIVIADNR